MEILPDDINKLCEQYLNMLDKRQNEVYAIRMMHHDVWKATRPSKLIKHHRAGSRVERQLRVLPTGYKSDVDYKYEVVGILVDTEKRADNLYYKTSTDSGDGSSAYGIVYVTGAMKKKLEFGDARSIFENAFHFDKEENAFILLPNIFKERVVEKSGMDMKKDPHTKITSPAISGHGAVNEYDAVPCLRLSSWPMKALNWVQRKTRGEVFCRTWKQTLYNEESLFIVPTGNPQSKRESFEWRLSFSFIEKKCFDQIHSANCPRIRQLYGILKLIFKKVFEKNDIFDSYHLKTLFLWKVENWSKDKWQMIPILHFVSEIILEMKNAQSKCFLCHFFVKDCNIFPFHKLSLQDKNIQTYRFENIDKIVQGEIVQVILTDMRVPHDGNYISSAFARINETGLNFNSYVNAYLTRLLSVAVHSLFENYRNENIEHCIGELRSIFRENQSDPYITRIIPLINSIVRHLGRNDRVIPSTNTTLNDMDRLWIAAFDDFQMYVSSNAASMGGVEFQRLVNLSNDTQSIIGVTILKMQVDHLENDPLNFIFKYLSEMNDQYRRFYIEPRLLLMYLRSQMLLKRVFDGTQGSAKEQALREFHSLLERMTELVTSLSARLPHVGKLSYRYIGVLLLKGYKRYLKGRYDMEMADDKLDSLGELHGLSRFSTNLDIT